MKCIACGLETDYMDTVVYRGKLIEGCPSCLEDDLQQGNSSVARENREAMKRNYRKDLVQKNMPREYIRAFGIRKAREDGFSEEQLRKYS